MTTPAWTAPTNGLPGDLDATNSTAGINQFLGAHAVQPIYEGARIIPADGGTQLTWLPMSNATDYDQPITMSGTAIGRVQLPLLPLGNGSDVHVALWPDNGSGAPNTSGNPLAATLVPAAYINTVAATYGLENATGPLMTQLDNEYGFTGSVQLLPWLAPAGDSTGSIANSVLCATSDSLLFFGGINGSSTILANCASTTAVNDVLAQPIPQPPLPQATEFGGATVVNNNTVIYLGGTTASTAAVTNTWAASWDPGNHVIGAWSAQAALPSAIQHSAVTSWGSTVYSLGGANASNTTVTTVYYATITNNQIGAWQTANPLPAAVADAFAAAVAGWLIVAGGRASFGGAAVQAVYYAKINADGSIGQWQTGPNMPNAQFAFACGWGVGALTNAFVQMGGHTDVSGAIQILSVTANGPAPFWYVSQWSTNGDLTVLPVSLGNGQWTVFTPLAYANNNRVSTLTPMPYVSVPLPASGLTNAATYHLLLRAVTPTSAADGVQLGTLDDSALPAIALQSPRYANNWTHIPTGWSVPLRVYDASQSGNLRHLWQDSVNDLAQSWSSVFFNAQKMLTGAIDITLQPNNPLNSNPTFTSGVSPWTAVNGSITQSSAQVHGGFAFSGLLAPAGGHATASAQSELFPLTQTPWGSAQWVAPTGWFYSPTGWANFSLSVNWYDSSQTLISTSSATVSLTANTWTQVTNAFQVPATAAYGQLAPAESGTPGATNLLYMSNVQTQLTPETVGSLTSAATVNYPSNASWPPTGVTQLL